MLQHLFFSDFLRFADICSDISGFAERVQQIYCKLLQRNYEVKLLEKTFNRFLCHHSDTLLKYGPNIQDLLYVCLNFKTSYEQSVVDHCTTGNVTYRSTYITSRIPVPLTNLGNTCYLNSILQVLFQLNTFVSFDTWINHLLVVDKLSCADNLQLLAFYKFLYLCKIPSITEGDLADFTHILEKINPFFKIGIQRDAHEALILLLESFSKICYLPILNNDTSFVPEFMDAFFYGIYRIQFNCKFCKDNNICYENFYHISIQPDTDISACFVHYQMDNKTITCSKCASLSSQNVTVTFHETPNILMILVNRFSVSRIHSRPRKNNQSFQIHDNIKLGLISYSLLGFIEHHGTYINSGHYICYTKCKNKWYHCNDKYIKETNLLTMSKYVYLMFYVKD